MRDRNAGNGAGYLAMGLVMKRWQGPSYTSEKEFEKKILTKTQECDKYLSINNKGVANHRLVDLQPSSRCNEHPVRVIKSETFIVAAVVMIKVFF